MKTLTRFILVIFLLWTMVYGLQTANAAVPHLINYQGRLTNLSGAPLNGSYNLTFRIYDAETAGNLLWEETHSGAVIQKGIFSILLGSVTNLDLAFDKPYFLEIKVGNEVMNPRQRITSSAYAIRAEETERFGGKTSSDYTLATDITSTPTANKAVRLDNNAKLPLSALKVYDSGWFAVSPNTLYTKIHNLGTTKCLINIYWSSNSDGSGFFLIPTGSYYYEPYGNEQVTYVPALTTTTIKVRSAPYGFGGYMGEDGTRYPGRSGYLRIIMLALE